MKLQGLSCEARGVRPPSAVREARRRRKGFAKEGHPSEILAGLPRTYLAVNLRGVVLSPPLSSKVRAAHSFFG